MPGDIYSLRNAANTCDLERSLQLTAEPSAFKAGGFPFWVFSGEGGGGGGGLGFWKL